MKGETRYIKIQKPGRVSFVAKTPQKMRQRTKNRFARWTAVSAVSMPATIKRVTKGGKLEFII